MGKCRKVRFYENDTPMTIFVSAVKGPKMCILGMKNCEIVLKLYSLDVNLDPYDHGKRFASFTRASYMLKKSGEDN